MNRFKLVVLLGLAAVAGVTPASGQEVLPGLAGLIDRGEIRVGMINRDTPPMIVTQKDGTLGGFDVDLANHIAYALGVKLTLVRTADTFQGVIDQVSRGDVDIGVSSLTRNVERAREVLFTRPYIVQNISLLYNRVFAVKQGGKCPTEEEFLASMGSLSVGVEAETAYIDGLKELDPDAKFSTYATFDAVTEALRAGEIDVAIQGEIRAREFLSDDPSSRVFMLFCTLPNWRDNLAIAVNGNEPDLVGFLNVLLDEFRFTISDGTLTMTSNPWN